MAKHEKPKECPSGRYTPMPHSILDSVAFQSLPDPAARLLFEALRQHNGKNNGHMQLTVSWLKRRNWTSNDKIQRAKKLLLASGLLQKTRYGGKNAGADLFALTWLPITNFVGLDIDRSTYIQGAWALTDPLPAIPSRNTSSGLRDGSAPPEGTANLGTVPPNGMKQALSIAVAVPPDGNNEGCQLPRSKPRSRVVGAAGRSGRKSTGRPGQVDRTLPERDP